MENLRLYCVHLSLLAIENNGARLMTNPLETNQKIPMIRRKIINETYSTKDLLIFKLEF